MTTKQDIERWFDQGVADGHTHLIVVCDTFSYEDYPVYVDPSDDPIEVHHKYDGINMQRVMEVYNLSMDKEEQLNRQPRCMQF